MKTALFSLPIAAMFISQVIAAEVYWDSNGPALGGGTGTTAAGTWGTSNFWNSDPDGGAGTFNTAVGSGDTAVFSAGNDVTGSYTVTVSGTQTVAGVRVEEGAITQSGGVVDVGAGEFRITGGASWSISTALLFNSGGSVVLDGGALRNTNPGSPGAFLTANKSLLVTSNGGVISYDDGSTFNTFESIYTASGAGIIGGIGGTPTAGVGTLTKTGPDTISVQGAGVVNFSFEKLKVIQGLYQIRNVGTPTTNGDRGFGADPAGVTADAILLNGGGISSTAVLTMHENRGITIGASGGTINISGGGSLTVPGPISGAGTLTVTGLGGSLTLQNAENASTFTGAVVLNGSTLTLGQSLNAKNLTGNTNGRVSIASGQTFTVGSDNSSTTYSGTVAGAGTFTKVGTGTLSLRIVGWANTGPTNINEGTIKLAEHKAGLSSASDVTIAAGATFDMNGIFNIIGTLAGAGDVINNTGVSAGLSLNGPASTTFDGTISGTAQFNKNASSTGVTTLTGNSAAFSGTTTIRGGTLLANNTTGSATGSGAVIVGSGGTLGGTGIIAGTVTLNAGGTIAPGASIESLDVASLNASGGTLRFELGAPGSPGVTSDLIHVTATGGLTLASGAVNLIDAGGLDAGIYTLIDYSGTLGGDVANLGTPTGPNTFHYALQNNEIDTTIELVVIPGVPGDFNDNGFVDAADYVLWRKPVEPLPANEVSTIGATDAQDYADWRARFGDPSPGAAGGAGPEAAHVPEPGAACLFVFGMFMLALCRSSR